MARKFTGGGISTCFHCGKHPVQLRADCAGTREAEIEWLERASYLAHTHELGVRSHPEVDYVVRAPTDDTEGGTPD